jgi:hypothetical protein
MNYRYQNIDIIKYAATGSQYYVNNVYPEIPPSNNDDYVVTVLGDRLDLLAFDFYGDSNLWWVIASANSLPGDSLVVEPGTQLRIPSNLMGALNTYKLVNAIR